MRKTIILLLALCGAAVIVSAQSPTATLVFTASADHDNPAVLSGYTVQAISESTGNPVFNVGIGTPGYDAARDVSVPLTALPNPYQVNEIYRLAVTAFGVGGLSAQAQSPPFIYCPVVTPPPPPPPVEICGDGIDNDGDGLIDEGCPPPPAGLPAPWVETDIGAPTLAGSAAYASGQFTINASGRDIWDNSDQFHYVYQPWTGNGQIVARVVSLGNTDGWAKAAVMIRSSLAANASHAMMIATAGNGPSLQWRAVTGGSSNWLSGYSQAIPVWVRLIRSGNTFTGSFSVNGTTWTQAGSTTITMPASVFVGLAVTSHNTGTTTTAVISNVTVQ